MVKVRTKRSTGVHAIARRGCAAVGAVAFTLVLGACGSSSSHAASGAAGGAAAPSGSNASSGGSGTGGGSGSCRQITRSMVQPLIAKPITGETVTPVPASLLPFGSKSANQQCVFAISDNSNAMTIVVIKGKDAAQAFSGDEVSLGTSAPVPGIGDKAYRDGSHGTPELSSIKGDTYCAVTPQPDEMPGVGTLMEAAGDTNNIGDGPFATIAAAVGTLCNRIYGSGNTTPDLSSITNAAAHAGPPSTGTLPTPTLPTP